MGKKIKRHHTADAILQNAGKISHYTKYPAFSFEFIQNGYDVRDCSMEDKAQFALTLSTLSKLNWAEIKKNWTGTSAVLKSCQNSAISSHLNSKE